MKLLLLALALGSFANGATKVIEDTTFKTTFSDYNYLDKMISCQPGFQGGYPTPDVVTLHSHAVELGYDVGNKPFRAYLHDVVKAEGATFEGPSERPYEKGCGPALEKFKAAIKDLDIVEVVVHRRVEEYMQTDSRVVRDKSGDVQSVKYFQYEHRIEVYAFELGGMEFKLLRSLNGKTSGL